MSSRMNKIIWYSFITLQISLSSLIAWTINIPELLTVLPGWVPIQFNTALGYTVSALATMGLLLTQKKIYKYLNWSLLIFALISLLDNYFHINSGVWFHVPDIQTDTVKPGLMSIFTSICLLGNAIFGLLVAYCKRLDVNLLSKIYYFLWSTLLIGSLFTITGLTGTFTLISIPTICCQVSLLLSKAEFLKQVRYD